MTIEPTEPPSDRLRSQRLEVRAGQVGSAGAHQHGPQAAIDWAAIELQALQRLDPGRLSITEHARGGTSKADAVHEAIAKLHAAQLAGEVLPTDGDAMLDLVVRKALRRWKALSKRAREQRHNLSLIKPILGTREMFDLICARDEQAKFFTRLYTELEDQPEARLLLYVILEKGILFHETRLLAQELHVSAAHVTNMKRRIVRLSRHIMSELTGVRPAGGRS